MTSSQCCRIFVLGSSDASVQCWCSCYRRAVLLLFLNKLQIHVWLNMKKGFDLICVLTWHGKQTPLKAFQPSSCFPCSFQCNLWPFKTEAMCVLAVCQCADLPSASLCSVEWPILLKQLAATLTPRCLFSVYQSVCCSCQSDALGLLLLVEDNVSNPRQSQNTT